MWIQLLSMRNITLCNSARSRNSHIRQVNGNKKNRIWFHIDLFMCGIVLHLLSSVWCHYVWVLSFYRLSSLFLFLCIRPSYIEKLMKCNRYHRSKHITILALCKYRQRKLWNKIANIFRYLYNMETIETQGIVLTLDYFLNIRIKCSTNWKKILLQHCNVSLIHHDKCRTSSITVREAMQKVI